MTNSIAFAKWVFTKLRENGTFNDNHDIDFIINQIDENYWQLFISTNEHYNAAKDAVDNIIPALVQKMPKTTRNNNNHKTKGKGKVFRADAQTSTNEHDECYNFIQTEYALPIQENNNTTGLTENTNEKRQYNKKIRGVQENDDFVQPEKKKKRQYKKKQPVQETTEVVQETTEVVQETTEVVQETAPVVQPEKKKRQYKKKQPVQETTEGVQETTEVVQETAPVVQPEKKKRQKKMQPIKDVQETTEGVQETSEVVQPEKKKRQKKMQPIKDVQETEDNIIINENDDDVSEKKKKLPKKIIQENNNIDVVIPNKEFAMLHDDSLQEEPFEINHSYHDKEEDDEEEELTELFIDDVLFYQDKNGNRFDTQFNPVDI